MASANSGTIRKLDQGCRRASIVSMSGGPPTGRAGVSRPSTTPAIVAWMPDSRTQTQRTTAGTTYDRDVANAEALEDHDPEHGAGSTEQPGERDTTGVEDRDHDDGTDVVDDREREQEQLQVGRDA